MGECVICRHELTMGNNPLTGVQDVQYCENCGVYWLKDVNGNLYPHCFVDIPQPLNEQTVPGAPQEFGFKLSIDTREERHRNIPHFHIYYGNNHRSVGYRIEDLSALDVERDAEFLHMSRDMVRFLSGVRQWQPKRNRKDTTKTNKQYMLDMYKKIVGVYDE